MTPVLWLCGPSGVGKTTIGWQIYSELSQSGVRAGFLDIDQLGICYPELSADPKRHRMKAKNLNEVIANFRAAGVQCVVVSGVVDPVAGMHQDLLPEAALTVCRLTAAHGELRQRYYRRSGRRAKPSEFDGVQTDVMAEADSRTDPADVAMSSYRRVPSGGRVVLLSGVTGVGKSTIGFELYTRALRMGRAAAYIDLDQVGFISPAVGGGGARRHHVKARNLAALWGTFRAAGATHLVTAGQIETTAALDAYRQVMPEATMVWLRAGRAEMTRRIMSRRAGGSWPEPGDQLTGQSAAYLRQVANRAVADAEELQDVLGTAIRIDTDGCSAGEAADRVGAATGWVG